MPYSMTSASAKDIWCATRRLAKALDHDTPWWFTDDEIVKSLTALPNLTAARCWSQHIRQRIGY